MTAIRNSLTKEPWLAVPDAAAWPTVGHSSGSLWGNEWSTTWSPSVSTEKNAEPKKPQRFQRLGHLH